MTNFVEGTTVKVMLLYLDPLLTACYNQIQEGWSLIRENALSTISSIADAARENMIPYFDKIAPIIYTILKNTTAPEHKVLRGQAIEALTMLGTAIGRENFKK